MLDLWKAETRACGSAEFSTCTDNHVTDKPPIGFQEPDSLSFKGLRSSAQGSTPVRTSSGGRQSRAAAHGPRNPHRTPRVF